MRPKQLLGLLAVVLLAGGALLGAATATSLATTAVTVGPFDITFYNANEREYRTGPRSAADWTQDEIDAVAASLSTWTNRITDTPGRQIVLHMLWYSWNDNTLGATSAPTNGDGTTSWTYVEHVWRDGALYQGPWTKSDCTIQFDTNAAGYSWNFSAAAPASSQIDFRSVMTHELGHALGFYPSYYSGSDKWGACWGTASSPNSLAGYLGLSNWDNLLVDDAGNRPKNNATGTPGNFSQVDNPVWFTGANAVAYYGGNVPVYAPSPYEGGSSLSHLDETLLPNALMSPAIAPGQMVRQPTPLEWEIMKDLGWDLLSTKTWTKGAGTLSWVDAANWNPSGMPDATWDVLFTNAGLTDGTQLVLGMDQSVRTLNLDTGVTFTIDGGSGALTIAKGTLTRTAASSGVQTITRPVALGASAVWNIGGSGQLTVSGAISGSTFGLEKQGDGTLLVSGASTYSGATAIKAGALIVGTNAPSGSAGPLGNATSSVLLGDTTGAANAALLIGGSYTVGRNITVQAGSSGTVTLGGTTSATATFSGTIGLARDALVTAAPSGTVAFTGAISGVGGLAKIGNGTVTLSGANAYSGATAVQTGTLNLGSADANSTVFTVASGAALGFTGGTHSLGGATFTNAGTINFGGATVNFDAATSVPGAVNFTSGTLGGGAAASFGAALTWTAGTMSGAGTTAIGPAGSLALSGTSTAYLYRTLNSAGTTTWTGTVDLNGTSSGIFNNQAGALFDIQNDRLMNWGSSQPTFNNAGTFQKSAGAATTSIAWVFNNTGSVQVQSGAVKLLGGGTGTGAFSAGPGSTLQFASGTFNLNAGSTVSGAGAVQIPGGTVNLAGAWNVAGATTVGGTSSGTLNLNAGASVSGAGLLIASNGTVNVNTDVGISGPVSLAGALNGTGAVTLNQLTWMGGSMGGTGSTAIAPGGSLALSASGNSTASLDRTLENSGTTTWTGPIDFYGNSSGIFNNQAGALFDIQNDRPMSYNSTRPTFNNAGTFQKSAGSGTTSITWGFNNTGTVEVESGTVRLLGGGTGTGAFSAGPSATLQFAGGTFDLHAGASVSGAGNVQITAGAVNLEGPWDVTGTTMIGAGTLLTVIGDYTQTAGYTTVDGQLRATDGWADILGGTLELNSDAGAGGAVLSLEVVNATVYLDANQHLDTLIIGSGGRVVLRGARVIVLNDLQMGGLNLGPMVMVTPEPATLGLLAFGALVTILRRRAS